MRTLMLTAMAIALGAAGEPPTPVVQALVEVVQAGLQREVALTVRAVTAEQTCRAQTPAPAPVDAPK